MERFPGFIDFFHIIFRTTVYWWVTAQSTVHYIRSQVFELHDGALLVIGLADGIFLPSFVDQSCKVDLHAKLVRTARPGSGSSGTIPTSLAVRAPHKGITVKERVRHVRQRLSTELLCILLETSSVAR